VNSRMQVYLRRSLWLASLLLTSYGSVSAQNDLPDKPYQRWSKGEAEKILNNSPWAKQQEVRIKFDKESQTAAGSYSGVSGSAAAQSRTEVTSQVPADFIFTLRLRSAVPVRQAVVRLKQLETNIEKMDPKDRAAFETQIKGLLDCPACANNYVITLSSKSKSNPGADAVYSSFKGGRLADLQRYMFIANERGERRQLIHFVAPKAPGDEAIFFFPRLDEKGAPLLTLDSKELLINLANNQADSITNFKIDVSKLKLNGKVEF
jgi:hypothetical protein